MSEYVTWLVKQLVDEPDAVRVDAEEHGDETVLRVTVAPDDVGKVIGRQGRVVRALRTLARAAAARQRRRVVLEIEG
jgi:predicted RNA-binding protein YlqC (UPF0109 family)